MLPTVALVPADKELFSLVARTVITNPFGPEREKIDARLDPESRHADGGGQRARIERIVRLVAGRLARLEAAGKADLRLYAGEDREAVSYTCLFVEYYSIAGRFDRLIQDQIQAGDEPLTVPYARESIARLVARGLDPAAAAVHFAMFFQIRRAFHFIHRALIGESRAMKEFRRSLWDNIFTCDIRWYDAYLRGRMEDFSTLLLGETGTGKGSAAGAIGRSGFIPFDEKTGAFKESFTRAFTALNLSEFPESLIESELFGHRKGAFTGAVESHEGILSRCSPHGSIFLDEIGESGAPVQIKLLRVLEERVFTPVGSHEKQRFRGRVIAATHRSLEELRASGAFRDDFFYRLSSDVIRVPTLRERLEQDPSELELLAGHVLRRLLGVDAPPLTSLVLEKIRAQLGPRYPWPGNVRELEQCVRRILLKQRYEGEHGSPGAGGEEALARRITEGILDAKEVLSAYCALLYRQHGSFEKAARAARMDPRTVKKHAEQGLRLEGRLDRSNSPRSGRRKLRR